MTIPVMFIAEAPAAAANSVPMGALLGARDLVATSAHKGAGFLAAAAAKLHFGAAMAWATRSLGWLVGRFSFLAKVGGFLGWYNTGLWIASSENGQALAKKIVSTVVKVVTWPLRLLGRGIGWGLSKIGLGRAVDAAQVGAALAGGSASWVAEKIGSLFNPRRRWVKAVHAVTGFRMTWALTAMSFIPSPITFVLRAFMLYNLVSRLYTAYTARKAAARAKAAVALDVAEEAFMAERRAQAVKNIDYSARNIDAALPVDQTTVVAYYAAESAKAAALAAELTEKANKVGEITAQIADAKKVEVLEQARVEHTREVMAAPVVDVLVEVLSQSIADEAEEFAATIDPEQVAAERKPRNIDEANLIAAQTALAAMTDIEYAEAMLAGEVPTHPMVMSRNRARKILKAYATENFAGIES